MFRTVVRIEGNPPVAYGFGAMAFAAALALRFWVEPALPAGFPYITFFPAVVLTAFFCGTGPGLLCATASGLAAWYWFIEPQGFDLNPATFLALAFYVFIVAVDIALIHVTKATMTQLRTSRERSAALADQQRVMFQELQHRVANNIQFVSSLLNLQKRQIVADPANALQVVDEARLRLDTIARIHRRLYDPETAQQPVGAYFQDLCGDLIEASGVRGVVCQVMVPRISFELPKLMNLSLITVEIVTNSLKHAFRDRGGVLKLSIDVAGDRRLVLTISDNGPGEAPGSPTSGHGSLGRRIVEGLVLQMDGEISYLSDDGGLTARLVFPA